jgi:pilus assembly protein Flp/PilA
MTRVLRVLSSDESGQGLAEYGLILALVAVASVLTLAALSGNLNGLFTYIGSAV